MGSEMCIRDSSASATAPEFAVDALGVASLTGETVAANLFVDAGNGIGVDNPTIEDVAFEAFTAALMTPKVHSSPAKVKAWCSPLIKP